MATIKLGSLITSIAGSIGGTTFRRFSGGVIMSNKVFGASKNRLLKNPALIQLKSVFDKWKLLSLQEKNNWSQIALNYTFPDKFGVYRNITGRQLFTKLVNSCFNVDLPIPLALDVNNVVPIFNLVDFDIQEGLTAWLKFDVFNTTTILQIQIELIDNLSIKETFTRRKIISTGLVNSVGEFDFGTQFWALYPLLTTGQLVRVYFATVNNSGFKSLIQTRIAEIN